MSSPPLHPMPNDITGEYYSSGEYHGAWDLPVPIGTPVHAVRDGTIHSCWRGVPNDEDQPGDTDYTGEPSNWILQWVMMNGNPYTVYYQHLSPNIKVHMGQKVRAGDVIAYSGDSGNTSGPHLHIHAMHGHQADRYALYSNRSVAVYPPSKLWADAQEDDVISEKDKEDIANMAGNQAREAVLTAPLFPLSDDRDLKNLTVRQGLQITTRFVLNNREDIVKYLDEVKP